MDKAWRLKLILNRDRFFRDRLAAFLVFSYPCPDIPCRNKRGAVYLTFFKDSARKGICVPGFSVMQGLVLPSGDTGGHRLSLG